MSERCACIASCWAGSQCGGQRGSRDGGRVRAHQDGKRVVVTCSDVSVPPEACGSAAEQPLTYAPWGHRMQHAAWRVEDSRTQFDQELASHSERPSPLPCRPALRASCSVQQLACRQS